MGEWAEYVDRARRLHGDKLDLSEINEAFVPYFRDGRVRVDIGGTWQVTGTVGVTTGWKPSLLLMRRSSDHGSSILLNESCTLLAVQRGRQYVEVAS